jgi:ABC-2 type transport system ATP-binding protein
MIEAHHLAKRHRDKLAVGDPRITVKPGGVTGFPGPNMPGKSPPMRLIGGGGFPREGGRGWSRPRYTR